MTADLDLCCLGLLDGEGSGTEQALVDIWRLVKGLDIKDLSIECFNLWVFKVLDEVD